MRRAWGMRARADGRERSRMRARAWLVALAVLVGLAVPAGLAVAPAAQAHGGYQLLAKENGPYSVVIRVRPFEYKGVDRIDVTSYVVRLAIGEPDLTTKVTVTLDGPDGRRVLHPEVLGDGYQSIIDAKPKAWRDWRVTATVVGSAGRSTVSAEPIGEDPGMPSWLFPVSLVVLLLLGGIVFVIRDRAAKRRELEAPEGADDDWAVPAADSH